MVAHLGHNVPLVFMSVFGVGTALAAVAGVIAGPALVTQAGRTWHGLLGPILFVVVVVGGPRLAHRAPSRRRSSSGLVQTFAVLGQPVVGGRFRFRASHPEPRHDHRGDLWNVDARAIAPITAPMCSSSWCWPSNRPGYGGRARHERAHGANRPSAAARDPRRHRPLWRVACGRRRIHRAAAGVRLRYRAHHDEPDGHLHRVRAVLQHAARPDRHALLRACGLLRARRLFRGPRHECRHGGRLAGAAARDPARRRMRGPRVRAPVRLDFDQAQRHCLRDDLARPRRARRLQRPHPAQLLRRRGGRDDRPHQAAAAVRHQLRSADRGLLPDRHLVPPLHVPDVQCVSSPARRSGRMCY